MASPKETGQSREVEEAPTGCGLLGKAGPGEGKGVASRGLDESPPPKVGVKIL